MRASERVPTRFLGAVGRIVQQKKWLIEEDLFRLDVADAVLLILCHVSRIPLEFDRCRKIRRQAGGAPVYAHNILREMDELHRGHLSNVWESDRAEIVKGSRLMG